MRTDGVFTLHKYIIPAKFGSPLSVVPFGDIHRDSPSHSMHHWNLFLDKWRNRKDAYFLGMGDYWDSFSASERIIFANPGIHESTAKRLEQEARDRINVLANEVKFMKDRTIGLLSGNHFIQYANGQTGDMLLAAKLNASFLGVCSAIRLTFVDPARKGGHHVSVDIFAHHGKGSGMTAGGRLNSVEKLSQIADADIYLMGDNHARGVIPLGEKLRIVESNGDLSLRSRKSWIGRTGSFLRAYVHGESSYVVDRALQPASLGWVEFVLTPRRLKEGGIDRLTVDIEAVQ